MLSRRLFPLLVVLSLLVAGFLWLAAPVQAWGGVGPGPGPGWCPPGQLCDPALCAIKPWLCPPPGGDNGDGGSGGGATPPPPPSCDPEYAAPSVYQTRLIPDHPVVLSQDPDREGVTLIVRAVGGRKVNDCDRGPARARITTMGLNGIALTPESQAWILGALRQWFPNAFVKDAHPRAETHLTPDGRAMELRVHFLPQDPGKFSVSVWARQDDGQQAQRDFFVPVHMLDTTLYSPGAP